MSLDVPAADIARIVLQFLKESGFTRSFAALQDESGISFNSVDDAQGFQCDVVAGNWEAVLRTLGPLDFPHRKLVDLFEQIVIELIEQREIVAARNILRQTEPMHILKEMYPERYLHLETLLSRTFFDPREAYPSGTTKEKRRKAIAQALTSEMFVVPPSRLLTLIGQAAKWQTLQGMITPDAPFDLLRGAAPVIQAEDDAPVTQAIATIKFPKKQHAEAAAFSPNGQYFATGSTDGFIEIWNHLTGKLRKDLKYQAEEKMMLMESAVLCLAFSNDSEQLVSGSQDGKIAVWRVGVGQCIKRFPPAHQQGVTSVCFHQDGSQILSASFDSTVRIHGLKSGRMLKEFRGHSSFVNRAIFSSDFSRVISGSSDGSVKIWDVRTGECLSTLYLHQGAIAPSSIQSHTVHTILATRKNPDHVIVLNQSPIAYVVSLKGKIVSAMPPSAVSANALQDLSKPSAAPPQRKSSKPSPDFVAGAMAAQGDILYCAASTGRISILGTQTGNVISSFQAVSGTEIVGLVHHPFANIVAVLSEDGLVTIWK